MVLGFDMLVLILYGSFVRIAKLQHQRAPNAGRVQQANEIFGGYGIKLRRGGT
jgi:hypothetical protein